MVFRRWLLVGKEIEVGDNTLLARQQADPRDLPIENITGGISYKGENRPLEFFPEYSGPAPRITDKQTNKQTNTYCNH